MDTHFSTALRAAVSTSRYSLEVLSQELAARGTPVSVSALSNWQTGENNPGLSGHRRPAPPGGCPGP